MSKALVRPGRAFRSVPSSRESYWRAVLADLSRSRLPQARFCRRRGLSPGTLAWWKYEIRRRERSRRRPSRPARPEESRTHLPRFIPLKVVERAPQADGARTAPLELLLSERRQIRIAHGFDEALLRRLVTVLESIPC